MTKRRSISERMQRSKGLDVRRRIAHDWSANWQRCRNEEIAAIATGIESGNHVEAALALDRLNSIDRLRFGALTRVIDALSDEDVV